MAKDFDIKIAQFYNTEILENLGRWLTDTGVKITLDVQNVDHVLQERLGASKKEVDKAKQLQIAAIAMSDHTFCRSEIDKQQIVDLGADPEAVTVYRGGIFANDYEFRDREPGGKKLVYLGHMYYQPNEEAIDRIVTQVLPRLDPLYSLTVIGSCPPHILKRYEGQNVTFTGGLDNLGNELLKYDVAIAPIQAGSGTRLKLLDYLASGLPTITTEVGIEGLDSRIRDCLVMEDNIENYPALIREITQNGGDSDMSARGRQLITDVYDWSHCVGAFEEQYKKLVGS
jgi:glycosyltransferase involved in cell wall biosynthesis